MLLKLNSYKLVWLQVIVISFSLFTMWTFLKSVPVYYDILRNVCLFEECQFAPMPPVSIKELDVYDLTGNTYAFLFVVMDALLILYFYITALIVFYKSYKEPMGLFAALMLVSFGTAFPSLVAVAGVNMNIIFFLGWSAFTIFFMLFPNGRFVPRWTSLVAISYVGIQLLGKVLPSSFFNMLSMPLLIKVLVMLAPLLTMGYSQIYRFMNISTPTERQQTKWVVYGCSLTLVGFILINFFYTPGVTEGALSFLYLNALINVCMSIIPTTLLFAILKTRLWDIDPIVNRTIVYGILSVCVIAVYIVSVSYLSRIFQTEDNVIVSLIATALVAVLFAPLKERLQRGINRLLYGKKEEPFSVLAKLSQQWEQPMTLEETLDVVCRTVMESLHLPYSALSLVIDSREAIVSSSGQATAEVNSIPIIHRGEGVGELLLSPRDPGGDFSKEDRKLLDVLIRQAGPIIQGVTLSFGMKLLVNEVQISREKLVLAREEERVKLRRNLHDDLAPRLAALASNVAAAERMVSKDPSVTSQMLGELKTTIRSTVSDIRTLVHDLRPPALDELGLAGAIELRVHELTKSHSHIAELVKVELEIDRHLPVLPAAVEVAIYRIVTESLVNVIRHSGAKLCKVKLKVEKDTYIRLEIEDDGVGLSHHRVNSPNGGIGMQSMREQAAELGGKCTFEAKIDGGMSVLAILPYETERRTNANLAG